MSNDLHGAFAKSPLIASVQVRSDQLSGSARWEFIARSAELAVEGGASALRIESIEDLEFSRGRFKVPVIGLIKRQIECSPIYITPEIADVESLAEAGCKYISVDATLRERPVHVEELIERAHALGMQVIADCDSLESGIFAARLGADFVATTLSGYTEPNSKTSSTPDLQLVRELNAAIETPVIAEGRYTEAWQVRAALTSGAVAVTIGTALNDPRLNAKRLLSEVSFIDDAICCVDIGGTRLRFGLCRYGLEIENIIETSTPHSHADRLNWIQEQAQRAGVQSIGISSGGVIDPQSGRVLSSKPIIDFQPEDAYQIPGLKVTALNDGLCSAHGIANHPSRSSDRFIVVSLGTGIGCGVVSDGRLVQANLPPFGQYPRLNDFPVTDSGTLEELYSKRQPLDAPKADFISDFGEALKTSLQVALSFTNADVVYLCGGFVTENGLKDRPWTNHLLQTLQPLPIQLSPVESPALVGAAALIRYPIRTS